MSSYYLHFSTGAKTERQRLLTTTRHRPTLAVRTIPDSPHSSPFSKGNIMYKVIGIDAEINCSCGTGMIIVQAEDDNNQWCWWHRERKLQTWFPEHQLAQEVLRHALHLFEEPIPFNPKKPSTALFASTDFLDFNRVALPIFFNGSRCSWRCLTSTQPSILVVCTSWISATQWLDDLARMTVHSIDRRLQKPSDTIDENETLRRMADIAIRIAEDVSIRLNLHVRICASMMENAEINQYFCNHVEGVYPDVEAWEFEKMMYAHIQNIQSIEHFFQQ